MTAIRLGSDGFDCDLERTSETACIEESEGTTSKFPSENAVIGSAICPSLPEVRVLKEVTFRDGRERSPALV